VPVALLDRAYAMASGCSRCQRPRSGAHRGGLRGYTPFGTEHAKDHRASRT
jgi:hypothetical protein